MSKLAAFAYRLSISLKHYFPCSFTNSDYFEMKWVVLILNAVNTLAKYGSRPPN